MYRFLWLLTNYTKENQSIRVGFCCGVEGDDFSLPNSVLRCGLLFLPHRPHTPHGSPGRQSRIFTMSQSPSRDPRASLHITSCPWTISFHPAETTIKCHRPSVVCDDQYAERAFVVAGWSVFVVFALLSTCWQISPLRLSFHLFFVPFFVLLPSYSLSSALAAIKRPRHFFACQVVHIYCGCVVEGPVNQLQNPHTKNKIVTQATWRNRPRRSWWRSE